MKNKIAKYQSCHAYCIALHSQTISVADCLGKIYAKLSTTDWCEH